jgi:hypothetical protein
LGVLDNFGLFEDGMRNENGFGGIVMGLEFGVTHGSEGRIVIL